MKNVVFLFVIALLGTRTSSLNVERANRISGGSPATDSQFPYMISLQQISQLSTYTRGHRCGGALVSLRHAVTSASCVYENRNGVFAVLNPREYRVFAGGAILTNDISADRNRLIESFTPHPNYTTSTPYVNDVAIITLATAFPSNVVSMVPLSLADATTIQGPICMFSGWGSQNHTSVASTQLMHTTQTAIDVQACQAFYMGLVPGQPQFTLQNSMICALANSISSGCAGDLGNPLVCNGNLNGVLIITGNDCSPGAMPRPEVYTRISSFRQWIETTMAPEPTTTTSTTTLPTTIPTPAPTPAGASTFQPGMAVLALISIVQIVTAKVLN